MSQNAYNQVKACHQMLIMEKASSPRNANFTRKFSEDQIFDDTKIDSTWIAIQPSKLAHATSN